MRYMHNCNLVHGRMKSTNIMINSEGRARICDIGPSNLLCNKSHNDNNFLLNWTSPEIIEQDNNLAELMAYPNRMSVPKCADIYSFGCIMFEILAEVVPWSHMLNREGAHEGLDVIQTMRVRSL